MRWAVVVMVVLGMGLLAACGSAPTAASETRATPVAEVATGPDPDPDEVSRGRTLALRQGCLGCHSVDGMPLSGPTWKGLFGSQLFFTDGTTTVADEAYLRQSIRQPGGKVVAGYVQLMTPVPVSVSDGDIGAIIAYIESLR